MDEHLPKFDVGYECWCPNRACVGFHAEAWWASEKTPILGRGGGQPPEIRGYRYPLQFRCAQCGTKWKATLALDPAKGDPPKHFHAIHDEGEG